MNKNYITSYEREKFELGKLYWTYFMETSKSGQQLRNHTGVFQVKCIEIDNKYGPEFDIIGGSHYKINHKANISTYMKGYGSAYCHFYNSEEDAIIAHDEKILSYSSHLDAEYKKPMYKKLISAKPEVSQIEIDAKAFFTSLPKEHKDHIIWLKNNDINFIRNERY
jgi:hypothetical protein